MSNFKEIYPQKNFIEELHRMDSLKDDGYEVLAFNGTPDYAPLNTEYCYELIKTPKESLNKKRHQTNDGVDMPLISLKLYGNSNADLSTKVGTYNSSTGMWETTFTDGSSHVMAHKYPLCKLDEDIVDVYDNGDIYYKTAYITLSGNSNWFLESVLSTEDYLVFSMPLKGSVYESDKIQATYFTCDGTLDHAKRILINYGKLYVSMLRIDTPDLTAFKQWLNENTIEVVYPRKITIKEEIRPTIELTSGGQIGNNQSAYMDIIYRIPPNAILWHREENGEFVEVTG